MQQDWSANLQVFLLVRTTSQNARLGKSTPNTQDRKFQEKLNPFHGRFTVRSIRFRLAKQIDIWIKIASSCSCVQNMKIPLKLSSFAREMYLIFRCWVLSIIKSTLERKVKSRNLSVKARISGVITFCLFSTFCNWRFSSLA